MRDGLADVLAHLSPGSVLGALVYLGVAVLLAATLSRALRVTVHLAMTRHGHLDLTTISFLQQFGSALIWVGVFILYASLVPVLRSMGTALLAGASIASVVIGLAAQSTLGNVVAGVSITIYRPFKLADTLQVAAPTGTETGVVETISLGYTTLRTADGRRVVLPNALAASQVTLNLTPRDGLAAPPTTIVIRVPRGSDLAAVRAAALEAARSGLTAGPGGAVGESGVAGVAGVVAVAGVAGVAGGSAAADMADGSEATRAAGASGAAGAAPPDRAASAAGAAAVCELVRVEAHEAVFELHCHGGELPAATVRSRVLAALVVRFAGVEPTATFG